MLVRRPVIEPVENAACRRVRIVHARAKIDVAEGLILVVEAPVVTNLLTGDQRSPSRLIVRRGVVIAVVELGRRLRNMLSTALEPDRRNAEPAAAPVGCIADQDLSGDRAALLRVDCRRLSG